MPAEEILDRADQVDRHDRVARRNYGLDKAAVEQQGIAYAQTIAGALNLKLDADNPAAREKLRRAILDLVAGRKMRGVKRAWLALSRSLSESVECCFAVGSKDVEEDRSRIPPPEPAISLTACGPGLAVSNRALRDRN